MNPPSNSAFVSHRQIETTDPQVECKRAVANGDTRFLGIMTAGLQVPGVPDYYPRFAKRYGIKIVKGTGDALRDEADATFQRRALSYAERYNQCLLRHLSK